MKLTNILVPFIKEELYLLINWIHNCPSLCKEKEKEKELNLHLSLDKNWSDFMHYNKICTGNNNRNETYLNLYHTSVSNII